MALIIPSAELARATSATATTDMPITAFRALQIANVSMIMEVSTQMLGQNPELVLGERPCWSVQAWFTLPDVGLVGQAGMVLVDAHTGEVLDEAETLREIAENVKRLAKRPAL